MVFEIHLNSFSDPMHNENLIFKLKRSCIFSVFLHYWIVGIPLWTYHIHFMHITISFYNSFIISLGMINIEISRHYISRAACVYTMMIMVNSGGEMPSKPFQLWEVCTHLWSWLRDYVFINSGPNRDLDDLNEGSPLQFASSPHNFVAYFKHQ